MVGSFCKRHRDQAILDNRTVSYIPVRVSCFSSVQCTIEDSELRVELVGKRKRGADTPWRKATRDRGAWCALEADFVARVLRKPIRTRLPQARWMMQQREE